MELEYDLKLVKLPRLPGDFENFYALGYYAENGDFFFALLSRGTLNSTPLRSIPASGWGKELKDQIIIIDKIEELP